MYTKLQHCKAAVPSLHLGTALVSCHKGHSKPPRPAAALPPFWFLFLSATWDFKNIEKKCCSEIVHIFHVTQITKKETSYTYPNSRGIINSFSSMTLFLFPKPVKKEFINHSTHGVTWHIWCLLQQHSWPLDLAISSMWTQIHNHLLVQEMKYTRRLKQLFLKND